MTIGHKPTSVAAVLLAFFLAGCGGSDEPDGSATEPASPSVTQREGLFTGTVGTQRYEVPVACSYFDGERFTFRSDRTDVTDTNGDDYIISGDQMGEKLILTVVDDGTTWSTPNLQPWEKNGDHEAVTGSGRLYEDGGENRVRDVSFTVECQT